MASLVRQVLYGWAIGHASRDLSSFVVLMQNASDEECAQALVATAAAAQWLQSSEAIDLPFPETYLSGEALARSAEDRTILSEYIRQLDLVRKQLKGEEVSRILLVGAGMVVLTHSLACVRDADHLLGTGKSLWRAILRGQAIAVEMTNALFVPRILVPDWQPPEGWQLGTATTTLQELDVPA
ncbi:hypothetical protein FHS85_003260 [Rhodoligotrophos appendicifer]|uniref:hypothetical protein n=1 Tax=Rhodoligotrophos appendicifer TaxID=987056 RepID=UPI001186FA83|nr:hypothetical protein [Rhodoligotrophos appendicifer]